MSADVTRRGLMYQDRYLLRRMLCETGAILERRFLESPHPVVALTRFGVEARPTWLLLPGTRGPAWDVVALQQQELEIIEVKSGEIRRPDRTAFWRRLRSEIALNPEPSALPIPVLVADPQRAGDLERWEQMAALATNGNVGLPRSNPKRVGHASSQLNEALWHLCVAQTDDAPPLTRAAALAVVSRLKVERHPATELAQAIARGIEVLFTGGLTEHIEDTILGWLNRRATSYDQGERFLTVDTMVGEMRLFDALARLAPNSLEQWRGLWHDLPRLFDERAQVSLGHSGQSLDALRTQPNAMSHLTANGRHVLVGQAGTGKTAFLRQCAERENGMGSETFRVAAESVVDSEQLKILFESLRFRRALLSLRAPERSFWLGVDGIDEVNDDTLQGRWARYVAQFAVGQQTTVFVSVRSSAWEEHAALRPHLDGFTILPVEDWSGDLVRELLVGIPRAGRVSPSLLKLLRRPLFLDLFLRTFVDEESPPALDDASFIETRHDLLDRFWTERVLRSRRPRPVDFPACLSEVLRIAAGGVGGFDSSSLDQKTVGLLVSEGVLVSEGEHAYRHRFRHPLLRDHALAFWCLQAGDSQSLVENLRSIRGGLQAQGALRAVFEVLLTADAETRCPSVELGEVTVALSGQPEVARALARLLGTLSPTPSMNPAAWPAHTQEALPAGFGRELLAVAHSEQNGGWAQAIQQWPFGATWLDEGFLETLCGYTAALFHLSNRWTVAGSNENHPTELAALQHARLAAARLRSVIGDDRFAAAAAQNHRHLQALALELVIKLVPDDETFALVEKEVAVATHRTSITILQELTHLAALDPARAATLFKRIIGLGSLNGKPTLDPTRWQPGVLEQPAVKGVLGGETGRGSLLAAHPGEFTPVALELAEAFSAAGYPMGVGHALWDTPLYRHNFWDDDHNQRSFDRCLLAIRQACGKIVATDPAKYLGEVASLLQQSPSAAVQSIYLDVLSERPDDAVYSAAFRASLFDARFYRMPLLLHWLEEALRRYWTTLDDAERTSVLALIDELAADPSADPTAGYRRAQLLATVPAGDLTDPRLQSLAATRAAPYVATAHPREPTFFPLESQAFANSSDSPDAWRIADWPPGFSADALLALSVGNRLLTEPEPSAEAIREHIPRMIAAADALLVSLEGLHIVLEEPRRQWMLEALAMCVEKTYADHYDTDPPSRELIEACARLALSILEAGAPVLNEEQKDTAVFTVLGSFWDKALQIADAALIWPSSQENTSLQQRFEQVWRAAFADGFPAVQMAVTRGVRPYHWLRDDARRRLDDELVWVPVRHGAVLAASTTRLRNMDGTRQAQVVRRMLEGSSVQHGSALADVLGLWMGQEAMDVLPGNQRRATVFLVNEAVHFPQKWPLLNDPSTRRTFMHWLAIGMQRMASQRWSQAPQLAADYGRWNLALWRAVRGLGDHEERDIVSIQLFWLPQDYPRTQVAPREPATMKLWWAELQHFCRSIAEEGTVDDVTHLLYQLQPGKMNHVLQAQQVFGWVEALLNRLEGSFGNQIANVPSGGRHYRDWKDVLSNSVHALDCLRRDELLLTDRHWESAFRLLNRLASPPFNLELALHVSRHFERAQL